MAVSKEAREKLYTKYNGKCTYCGCELEEFWHTNHIVPEWHTWTNEDWKKWIVTEDSELLNNLTPSCPECDMTKGKMTVEEFRVHRIENGNKEKFYFETIDE